MSHDVSYRGDHDHGSFLDVAVAHRLLAAIGLRPKAERQFHLALPGGEIVMEVHLACVDCQGEASEAVRAEHPTAFNRLDTHVPAAVAGDERAWWFCTRARIALARSLGWQAGDVQHGLDIAGPMDLEPRTRFTLAATLEASARGTVAMHCPGEAHPDRSRPKGAIVARDADVRATALVHRDDGSWLVGRDPGVVGRAPTTELRGADFGLLASFPGAGDGLALHPDGRWLLAGGPTTGGYTTNLKVLDLGAGAPSGAPGRTILLSRPFAWVAADRRQLVATVPRPDLAEQARSQLSGQVGAPLLDASRGQLAGSVVRLDLDDETVTPTSVHGALHLVGAPPAGLWFYATHTDVGAVELTSGTERWRRVLGRFVYGKDFCWIKSLALDPSGRYLALAAQPTRSPEPHELVVLDAHDGRTVLALRLSDLLLTRLWTLAWHPGGWIVVGAENGGVAHVDLDGQVRTFKGSARRIEALGFGRDGRDLVVAGVEKALRVHPLLEDECTGARGP